MDAYIVLLVAALSVSVGFIASYLFKQYKAPDVLLLIGFGLVIGPSALGFIDATFASKLVGMMPYVAALALAVIMLQAGMGLNIRDVIISFKQALILTILAFILSVSMITALCMIALGWTIGEALLLGFILGGTSGAVVIPLLCGIGASKKTKVMLTLEAAITDVLVVVLALTVVALMVTGSANLTRAIAGILTAFFASAFIGIIGGIIWLKVLAFMKDHTYSYIITLAALLAIFAGTEIIVDRTGGGAIAALVFGLTLTNGHELNRFIKKGEKIVSCEDKIKNFHEEISFFVRTFFFIYLGVVLSTIHFQPAHIIIGIAIVLALLIGRLISAMAVNRFWDMANIDRMTIVFMLPRGLCAAVLASVPLSYGVVSGEIGDLILGTTAVVIILTTSIASVGAFIIDWQSKACPSVEKEAPFKQPE